MRSTAFRCLLLLVCCVVAGSSAHAEGWVIQGEKSRVRFEVGHHDYVKPVHGRFRELEGVVHYDADAPGPQRYSVDVAVAASSIDTDNRYRDGHLRGSFFAADDHPVIRFRAQGSFDGKPESIQGELTLKGVTHPLRLEIESLRATTRRDGTRLLRARATGVVNRRRYGVEESTEANSALEKLLSGIQVGLDQFIDDEVRFSIRIVAVPDASRAD